MIDIEYTFSSSHYAQWHNEHAWTHTLNLWACRISFDAEIQDGHQSHKTYRYLIFWDTVILLLSMAGSLHYFTSSAQVFSSTTPSIRHYLLNHCVLMGVHWCFIISWVSTFLNWSSFLGSIRWTSSDFLLCLLSLCQEVFFYIQSIISSSVVRLQIS